MYRSIRSFIFRLAVLLLVPLLSPVAPSIAAPTSTDDARLVVINWLGLDASPLGMQLSGGVKEVRTFSDDSGRPLYHIVYLNTSGFVIVAGDDLVEPIVGFLAEGTYDPSWTNPLGALVGRDVPTRVLNARQVEQDALLKGPGSETAGKIGEAKSKWDWLKNQDAQPQRTAELGSISDVRVSPIVESRWAQGDFAGSYCYNYHTPEHYVCGCVATAMAQLMRYHSYPTQGVGVRYYTFYVCDYDECDYSEYRRETGALLGGDGSGGPYQWDDMPPVPGLSITLEERQAIGSLTRDAGLSINTYYAKGGSGAYTEDAATALMDAFYYSNAVDFSSSGGISSNNLNRMVNPNLDASFPVILGIRGIDEGHTVGHAILADGYGYNASTLYHHLNMGWSGTDDAWYNLPDIDIDPPEFYFDVVTKCIYNVYKDGEGEIISGRVTDAAERPIGGATVTAVRTGGQTYSSTTNQNGIFAIPKLPSASTYLISVKKAGYRFPDRTESTLTSTDYSAISGNVWNSNFIGTPAANDISSLLMLLLSK